jgi:COMPASS component SWD2
MTSVDATPIAALPTQKVSDVVTKYRPCKVSKHKPRKINVCYRAQSRPQILQPTTQGDADVYITSLDFDDTGEFLVAACDDETIQLYNAKEGKHSKVLYSKKYGVHLAKFTHQPHSVLYASTKVDGMTPPKYMTIFAAERRLILVDALRLLSIHDSIYQRYFIGHTAAVTSIALSPGSDSFLSCSLDNTVRLWDLNSRNSQGKLNLATPYLAAFDPSASVIAIASPSTSSILLYDFRNYDKPPFVTFNLQDDEQRYTPGSVGRDWTKLEFSNDGKSLVLGTDHGGHFVLDAFDGKVKAFLRRDYGATGRKAPGSRASVPLGQGDICLSPDGRYVLGYSGKNDMAVWDLNKEADVDDRNRFMLDPLTLLPFRQKSPIVQCNPKYNMIATADKEVVFWLPGDLTNGTDA